MDNFGKRIDAHTVRFERLLPGPVEKVWAHITETSLLPTWFGAEVICFSQSRSSAEDRSASKRCSS